MIVSAYSVNYTSYSAKYSFSTSTSTNADGGDQLQGSVSSTNVSLSQLALNNSSGTDQARDTQDGTSAGKNTGEVALIAGAESRIDSAAGNILNFISQQLAQDVADGATQEELQSRLQAGLSGFVSGYGAAADELGGLAEINPALAAEIQATYDKVIEGIGELSSQYLDEEHQLDLSEYQAVGAADTRAQESAASSVAAPVAGGSTALIYDRQSLKAAAQTSILKSLDFVAEVQKQVAERAAERQEKAADNKPAERTSNAVQQAWEKYSYASLQGRSFSFELVTEEGDVVTIQASAAQAYSANARYYSGQSAAGDDKFSQLKFSDQALSASQFSFEVEGDLNTDELTAINDLLNDVTNLASVFYGGDIDGAYEQALALGYDDEQISSFSLNLTQVSVEKATYEYRGSGAERGSLLADRLQSASEFMQGLDSLLSRIEQQYAQQSGLLETLLDQAAAPYESRESAAEQGKSRLREFAEGRINNRATQG